MYKLSSFKHTVFSLITCGVFMWGGTAWAGSIISIDLFPGMAGIQTTRTVVQGSSFTIDVVYTGDGIATFDTFAFAADFNDSGAVLGLAGGATAGSIAMPISSCVGGCLDAFSAAFVMPGDALVTSLAGIPSFPFPISPFFTASSDGVGILSIGLPFGGGVPIPVGDTIDLFSLTFDALMAGTSTVLPSDGGGFGGLALDPDFVPFTLASGTVTVARGNDPVVPEPGTMLLMGSGIVGLIGWRWRQGKQ